MRIVDEGAEVLTQHQGRTFGIRGAVDVVHRHELVVDELDETRAESLERHIVVCVGETTAEVHHVAVGSHDHLGP